LIKKSDKSLAQNSIVIRAQNLGLEWRETGRGSVLRR